MIKTPKRSISVCIDWETYEKLREIANQESRTISGQVFFWIRNGIRAVGLGKITSLQVHRSL